MPDRRFRSAGTGNKSRYVTDGPHPGDVRGFYPNETSTALSDARDWLLDHPEDKTVISAMEELLDVERQTLGTLSSAPRTVKEGAMDDFMPVRFALETPCVCRRSRQPPKRRSTASCRGGRASIALARAGGRIERGS